MKTTAKTTTPATHSATTQAVAACRLAAIAAIAEPLQLVAKAYAQQAWAEFERATEMANNELTPQATKSVNTAHRWCLAADAAAASTSR